MSIQLEIVGKLSIGKETDKFKPYEETEYPSKTKGKANWIKRKLSFNVISGDNRHLFTIDGGKFADDSGKVYLFSKGYKDDAGNQVKGEAFDIPFSERLTSSRLAEVAEFKKFVIDTEKPSRRYKLEKMAEKIHEGKSVTDEELQEVGIENPDNITPELEKSKKRRKEFVSQWDYAEFIKKLIDSKKYEGKKFKILGEIDYTYSEKNQKFYENFIPTRIYLANDDETEVSHATINFLYNKDSLDDGSVEEKDRYYINGYVNVYNSDRKKNIPCPLTISLKANYDSEDEKLNKIRELYVKWFTINDDSWKELGVIVDLINGSQKVEIDESMLNDEQQDLLLLGEITLDDIRAEMGGSVYGDRIQEKLFYKIAKGYTKGRKDTVYQDSDFIIEPIQVMESTSTDVTEEILDDDLFGDDEIL